MANRVSIKDVAREAGVSIATVSNVLNQKNNVGEKLQTRVRDAVSRLGYCVNPIARSLKSRKTDTIGVIVSDLSCIFFNPMLCVIQDALYNQGYSVTVCDTRSKIRREIDYAQSLQSRADGIIRIGLSAAECEPVYARIAATGLPVVSLEHDFSAQGVDSILVDNRKCAYLATSHLIELGCRRIAHITLDPMRGLAQERHQGYLDALAEAGVQRDGALLLSGDFSPISGFEATNRLIHGGVPFDGVFAANDQMAVGALRALQNAGIDVPGAVKLVGFDNTFISSIVSPALTTISVSAPQMGRMAVQRLLARMRAPASESVRALVDYELIIRRSTMASARTLWTMSRW